MLMVLNLKLAALKRNLYPKLITLLIWSLMMLELINVYLKQVVANRQSE
jgi:hypothetical protein